MLKGAAAVNNKKANELQMQGRTLVSWNLSVSFNVTLEMIQYIVSVKSGMYQDVCKVGFTVMTSNRCMQNSPSKSDSSYNVSSLITFQIPLVQQIWSVCLI